MHDSNYLCFKTKPEISTWISKCQYCEVIIIYDMPIFVDSVKSHT
jgi:hypothetical protein